MTIPASQLTDEIRRWLFSANERYLQSRKAKENDVIRVGAAEFITIKEFIETLPNERDSFDAFIESITEEVETLDLIDHDAVLGYCHSLFFN